MNKQLRTAHTEWSSSLGVGLGANNSSPYKRIKLRNVHTESLGPGLVLSFDLSSGASMGERRCVYRDLVGKDEGKRAFGRPRRRLEDNIKVYLQEVGCGVMDWIELAHDWDRWRTLVNAVMNLRVP